MLKRRVFVVLEYWIILQVRRLCFLHVIVVVVVAAQPAYLIERNKILKLNNPKSLILFSSLAVTLSKSHSLSSQSPFLHDLWSFDLISLELKALCFVPSSTRGELKQMQYSKLVEELEDECESELTEVTCLD
ncbi:uncharacterized protein [Spinacia oleracea]|uniref:Uncharacterized protein n=1 Tax=Spinacia oleracea TaxID=3562 RepID=A0ABM3R9D9_SPIOL|nr:uncharacterized protein LOC130467677 [Spinacia oleracea]